MGGDRGKERREREERGGEKKTRVGREAKANVWVGGFDLEWRVRERERERATTLSMLCPSVSYPLLSTTPLYNKPPLYSPSLVHPIHVLINLCTVPSDHRPGQHGCRVDGCLARDKGTLHRCVRCVRCVRIASGEGPRYVLHETHHCTYMEMGCVGGERIPISVHFSRPVQH